MEQNSERFQFSSDSEKEFVGLTCPNRYDRISRRHPSEVGGRLPRSLEYLIRKLQALFDSIDDARKLIRRRRSR